MKPIGKAPLQQPLSPTVDPAWAIWFTGVSNAVKGYGQNYAVSGLPLASVVAVGSIYYAGNGRKSGEGAGAGTGIPVWTDGTVWRTFYDNTQVQA